MTTTITTQPMVITIYKDTRCVYFEQYGMKVQISWYENKDLSPCFDGNVGGTYVPNLDFVQEALAKWDEMKGNLL